MSTKVAYSKGISEKRENLKVILLQFLFHFIAISSSQLSDLLLIAEVQIFAQLLPLTLMHY